MSIFRIPFAHKQIISHVQMFVKCFFEIFHFFTHLTYSLKPKRLRSCLFQLCTTPIYVSLICLTLKKGKLRDCLLSYMAYVTILGSISTILIPESCFVSDILVNIHTMWLHLGSFVVSIYIIMMKEVKPILKNLKYAIIAFTSFVGIALFLNITAYNLGILKGEVYNMFYISPYFPSTLPVFDIIYQNVPYIIFLLIYISALSAGGILIFSISWLINKIYGSTNKKILITKSKK